MPEMAAAVGTRDLDAHHAVGGIAVFIDGLGIGGREEARPAGAGIIFGVGSEQVEIAGDTPIQPRLMIVPIGSAERPFGASFARDPVLLGRELFLPFGLGFDDFLHGHIR